MFRLGHADVDVDGFVGGNWRHVRTGFRAVDAEVWAWLRFFGGGLLWLLGFLGLIVLVFYLLR